MSGVETNHTERAYCWHCGNRTILTKVFEKRFEATAYISSGEDSGLEYDGLDGISYVAVCGTCDRISVFEDILDYRPAQHFTVAPLAYPDERALPESVPEKVRECYEEAARVMPVAPNAFASQIRRGLEAICNDRKCEGRNLKQKLDFLATNSALPAALTDMTNMLRLMGNDGAHASGEGIRPGHVSVLDQFFRAIIEYVYIAPERVASFKRALSQAKSQ